MNTIIYIVWVEIYADITDYFNTKISLRNSLYFIVVIFAEELEKLIKIT